MLGCCPLSALQERRSDFWPVYLFFSLYAVLPAPDLPSFTKCSLQFSNVEPQKTRGGVELRLGRWWEMLWCCVWSLETHTRLAAVPALARCVRAAPARQHWPDSRYQPSTSPDINQSRGLRSTPQQHSPPPEQGSQSNWLERPCNRSKTILLYWIHLSDVLKFSGIPWISNLSEMERYGCDMGVLGSQNIQRNIQ